MTRAIAIAVLGLLLALLLVTQAWLLRGSDASLYEVDDDYAALALGHGIEMDYWKEAYPASRTPGYFQINHPGLPLQAVSGLLYQLSREAGATAEQRAVRTLAAPSRFLEADRVAVVTIFWLGLAGLLVIGWRRHRLALAIVPLAILAYAPAWPYHLELVGNETFALPLFLFLWLAVQEAVVLPLRPWAFLLAGVVSGVAYLNKLNYVAWVLGAGLALAWSAARAACPWSTKLAALGSYVAGVGGAILGLGTAFLGPGGLARMFRDHGKVFLNTGHYGEGAPGVVDPGVAWGNLQAMLTRDPVFTAWLAGTLLLLAWAVFRELRRSRFSVEAQSMLLFLSASLGLGFLAALKHFNPHYLIPPLMAVPFAVLSFRRSLPPLAFGALVLVTATLVVRVALAERARLVTSQTQLVAYRDEIERVRAMPVEKGIRAWTYKALAAEYGVSFVTDIANHRQLDRLVYPALFPRDRGYFREIPRQVPWDLVVYTRRYFPRLTDVPAKMQAVTDVALDGQYLLVLRRKESLPALHSPR